LDACALRGVRWVCKEKNDLSFDKAFYLFDHRLIALGGSRGDRAALRTARSESELLHATIWSVVEGADQPGRSNAILSSLITAANEVIDLHELRLASIYANAVPKKNDGKSRYSLPSAQEV
jgi:hypothetical protein